jgi:hypothetical protein
MRVPHRHPQPAMAQQLGDRTQRRAFHHQPGCEGVSQVVPAEVGDAGGLERGVNALLTSCTG